MADNITLIEDKSSEFQEIKILNTKKKSLPRGIEPRSPALIGVNDKRKSSPLDQGRLQLGYPSCLAGGVFLLTI